MQTDKFIITITHTGKTNVLTLGELIAARAWTLDGVEDTSVKCITSDPFTSMAQELEGVRYRSARGHLHVMAMNAVRENSNGKVTPEIERIIDKIIYPLGTGKVSPAVPDKPMPIEQVPFVAKYDKDGNYVPTPFPQKRYSNGGIVSDDHVPGRVTRKNWWQRTFGWLA